MSIEENLSSIATSLRDISVSLAAVANVATPKVAEPKMDSDIAALTKAPKSESAATGAPAATPAPAPATAATAPATVPYGDLQKAVLAMAAKKGKDAVIRLLDTFGLKTAKDAKPEQYGEIINAVLKATTE